MIQAIQDLKFFMTDDEILDYLVLIETGCYTDAVRRVRDYTGLDLKQGALLTKKNSRP